jgi:glutamine amidotransferase
MIAVVDYDMGNLRSVSKAFEHIGAEAVVTRDPCVIKDASHVVLPGVGAFKDCMRNLTGYGLVEPIIKSIESGKPFLGICLGLQLLFEESTEFGLHKGLGVVKGRVVRFQQHMSGAMPGMVAEGVPAGHAPGGDTELKVPHMGWNGAEKMKESPLLQDVPDGSYFYFVHSYYAIPEDDSVSLTTTEYGLEFTSSISVDNVTACQFHPEKSQKVGLKVLKNFSDMS